MRPSASSDELGVGSHVAEESLGRLLNPDGTFNVARRGLPFWQSLHLYQIFTRMSWLRFYLVTTGAYLLVNLLFGAAFFLAGRGAVQGFTSSSPLGRFKECFYFSVQTFSTIGYGSYYPATDTAHLLVLLEAVTGLFFVALATGMVFARFSHPQAKILFSERAVIAPFKGGKAFMFRIANARKNQLLDVEARVVLSRRDDTALAMRRFFPLTLERDSVMFLPLHWVVVHPIDEKSPLWELDEKSCPAASVECLAQIRGVDEANSETVHARISYEARQFVWNARFADMYDPPRDGVVGIDMRKLSDIEPIEDAQTDPVS